MLANEQVPTQAIRGAPLPTELPRQDMNYHVLWISDFNMIGSGYLNISTPLCQGLQQLGFDVKVAGLGYKNEEHPFDFGILPAQNLREVTAIAHNLIQMWKVDCVVVAMDIPIQIKLVEFFRQYEAADVKYIGIMPVEADPLMLPWAAVLQEMDKVFIISEFGTEQAKLAHVEADNIEVGLDTESWRPPTDEERAKIRKAHGIEDDTYVVLTVADNQERKNLAASFEIFGKFHEKVEDSIYIVVTRPDNVVGWNLKDLARQNGFLRNYVEYERGLQFRDLWGLYAAADCFMLTSKAEGLGMPVLESMACGLPVMATHCTANLDHFVPGKRGYPIPHNYIYIDPFGNANRYMADIDEATEILLKLHKARGNRNQVANINRARKYVVEKDWNVAIDKLQKALNEIAVPGK